MKIRFLGALSWFLLFTSVLGSRLPTLADESGSDTTSPDHVKTLPPTFHSNKSNKSSFECTDRQFRCTDGSCLHMSFVCDGEPDCSDGKDEFPEECSITGKIKL
ncbi:hypothetical protein DMENIID0001_043940 [Sergentomyia squamirostris]